MDYTNRDGQDDVRFGEWVPTHHEVSEPFVQVPKAFLTGLTPEEWRAMQEVYQAAYRRAVEQQRRLTDDRNYDPLLDFGDGI